MRLQPYQARVLQWFADPTRSRRAADIATGLGYTVKTVRQARSLLIGFGLLRSEVVVEVTPAGQALLQKE